MNLFSLPSELLSGMAVGSLAVLIYCIFRSFVRIDQGHLATVTSFGAAHFSSASEKKLELIGPGLHFHWPWHQVKEFSMMERITDLTRRTGGMQAIAEDGTLLKLDAKLRIQPVRENLYAYLFELRHPVEHIQEYFKCLVRYEIANFKDSYSGIRTNRFDLNQRISKISDQQIGTKFGIKFNAVDIVDIVPPEELDRALNAVQNAQAEADAQYSRALADRDQRLTAARSANEIASDRARATETEILVLGRSLRELKESDTLEDYLGRRRTEVYSGAKLSFIKN